MAQALRAGQVTPADELRDLLTFAEKRLAKVRGSGDHARLLLDELDRIAYLWPQLEAQGVDLRPEAGRWTTIQKTLAQKAGPLLAELKRFGGIEALRREAHPSGTDAPWWNLDTLVRERRARSMRRAAVGLAAVAVIVAALYFLLRALFPVDPLVQESLRRVTRGEDLVQQSGDYAGALAEFEAAAQATPDDPDVWLRVGAAREQTGDAQGAQQAFARARDLSSSELDFLRARGRAYLALGMIDPAEEDLRAAVELKSDDAQAWYMLANVYESRSRIQEAIDALDKSSRYASETGQDELTAMARYRMGLLMQQLQLAPEAEPTPATPQP